MPETADTSMTVLEALSTALERMAFVSLMPLDEPPAEIDQPVNITIRFGGPVTGTISITTSRQLGVVLAANVLGVEPDAPEAASNAADALKEMANVTCGVLMPMLNPEARERAEMHVPQIEDAAPDAWAQTIKLPGVALVDADGVPLAIQLKGAA